MRSASTGIAGELKDLRRNWGSAYEITETLGVWRAVRRDILVTLIATGPEKLRDRISVNYNARPVPRDLAAAVPLGVPHPLLTSGEVSDAFGVDPRTVRKWEAAGYLASIHLPGGIHRYFRAQVEAIVRGRPFTPEQVRAERERAASWPVPRWG